MDDFDFDPTVSFAVWQNAFTPTEVDQIEAYGDRFAPHEATVAADERHDVLREDVRVTHTAAILPTAESGWIYDRLSLSSIPFITPAREATTTGMWIREN